MNRLKTIGTAMLEHHGFFSIDQIVKAAKISRKYCRDVLSLFCQEGSIKQISKGRKEHVLGKSPMYAMIYRVNRKKLAARIAPQRKEDTVQDRIWYVMRNRFRSDGSFNLHDLMLLAGAKRNTARWYLKALHRGGYIAPSHKAGPGVEWRLTRDLGPVRPFLQYRSKAERKRCPKRPV
jgi:hypothetical protein